ncbi:hypothetical protein [Nonomuraea sp. NPDC049028]|uniref:hypothetical protein n=1 Tax=Nonomuraea sp. NPDC049028 TaxID=3364348 RepID=UPI003714DAE3
MDEPIHSIITSLDGHINDTDGTFGSTTRSGAVILGRRLFDVIDGPKGWNDDSGYGAREVGKPAPVVLGAGTPLFTGAAPRTLVRRSVTPTSTATHLTYDIL